MEPKVVRSISFLDGVCLIVGLILGVGIYQTPPLIAASVGSEVELYLVWIVGAVLTLTGAATYIELASTYPRQGGDYFFLRYAFGRQVGFLYGWSQIFLIRPGAVAAIAFPFASYTAAAIPGLGTLLDETMLACLIIFVLTLLNCVGTVLGLLAQNVLSILSYGLLAVVGFLGAYYGEHTEIVTHSSSLLDRDYGLALILVLFTFGGWSELALVAGEVKQPRVNFFRAMVVGISLIALVYCLINYAFCRALSFEGLRETAAPASFVVPWLGVEVIAALVALCCLSSLNALILASARISFAFGSDFRWFQRLGVWNERRNAPLQSLILLGALSMLIALAADSFSAVLVYTTAVVWLFYFAVGLSLFVLRRRDRDVSRPHPVWGYPIVPIIFCCSCLYLIYSALKYDLTGSLVTLGFVALGVVVFQLQERTRPEKHHE